MLEQLAPSPTYYFRRGCGQRPPSLPPSSLSLSNYSTSFMRAFTGRRTTLVMGRLQSFGAVWRADGQWITSMLEPLQSSGTWWGETLKGTTVLHDEDNDGTSTERRISLGRHRERPKTKQHTSQPTIPRDSSPTTIPTSFTPFLPPNSPRENMESTIRLNGKRDLRKTWSGGRSFSALQQLTPLYYLVREGVGVWKGGTVGLRQSLTCGMRIQQRLILQTSILHRRNFGTRRALPCPSLSATSRQLLCFSLLLLALLHLRKLLLTLVDNGFVLSIHGLDCSPVASFDLVLALTLAQ
jgi:hypothetical protein